MTSTKAKASLIILSSIGIVSAATFLFNLGMGIWGFVVQSEIKSEKNDEKCSASLVSDLMLTYSILLIISAVGAVCHFLAASTDQCLFHLSESSTPNKAKPCYSLSQCCFSVIGVAAIGVLIAMTVYLYKDSCKDLRGTMYQLASPYVITQYVAFFIFNLCSVCIMSCIQCCGIFGVTMSDSRFEKV